MPFPGVIKMVSDEVVLSAKQLRWPAATPALILQGCACMIGAGRGSPPAASVVSAHTSLSPFRKHHDKDVRN
jgi:hypothetical protein